MRNVKVAGLRRALVTLGLEKWAFKGNDVLAGGAADNMRPSDFDPKRLAVGARHEREHVKSKSIATEIASDHLAEDPRYYQKLKKIEK